MSLKKIFEPLFLMFYFLFLLPELLKDGRPPRLKSVDEIEGAEDLKNPREKPKKPEHTKN